MIPNQVMETVGCLVESTACTAFPNATLHLVVSVSLSCLSSTVAMASSGKCSHGSSESFSRQPNPFTLDGEENSESKRRSLEEEGNTASHTHLPIVIILVSIRVE